MGSDRRRSCGIRSEELKEVVGSDKMRSYVLQHTQIHTCVLQHTHIHTCVLQHAQLDQIR